MENEYYYLVFIGFTLLFIISAIFIFLRMLRNVSTKVSEKIERESSLMSSFHVFLTRKNEARDRLKVWEEENDDYSYPELNEEYKKLREDAASAYLEYLWFIYVLYPELSPRLLPEKMHHGEMLSRHAKYIYDQDRYIQVFMAISGTKEHQEHVS